MWMEINKNDPFFGLLNSRKLLIGVEKRNLNFKLTNRF